MNKTVDPHKAITLHVFETLCLKLRVQLEIPLKGDVATMAVQSWSDLYCEEVPQS